MDLLTNILSDLFSVFLIICISIINKQSIKQQIKTKGQRDNVTTKQRDNETKGKMDKQTKIQ